MFELIKYKVIIALGLLPGLFFCSAVHAVETAPRISDREIVESLTELKQGQKNLNQRIDDLIYNMDKRFEAMDKRFDSIDKRFETVDKRFEAMHNMILTLFCSVMALVIALMGYMVWDRKTAQQPLRSKMLKLEENYHEVNTLLEIQNPSGPVVARILASFRKLAETDEKVAAILKTYSLL
ncbi:hypothetical protein DO021_11580 [Desulfobacter hydrogenophilus]|uniref:t-SNARE coiled-coil homology domain-containing protein n=1 Tax=Desulfobacter hydrogenophilus TaxID=2291 RepID=A0A328FB80_9BACT|nr:hypothetical protein [Desulfobacter hydrogenophilus]NDY73804.1 hypothetical protein [Desulfobacter hydrogenophilus]QBH13713.1 hypothetical protein EYB58_12755 [Desulfobacter hydrogenophilus]RAM01901.1 hypothetical protein DO021_11580 [Desulfobacter hydrogenophilus]